VADLDLSTRLALNRTRVAYDRTLMAWIRTATSLIGFGFSVYKFFQLEPGRPHPANRLIGYRGFALLMVGIGLLSLLIGVIEYRAGIHELLGHYPAMFRSATPRIAALIAVLGILAFLTVMFRQ
jgi:inner membrane protein YidH